MTPKELGEAQTGAAAKPTPKEAIASVGVNVKPKELEEAQTSTAVEPTSKESIATSRSQSVAERARRRSPD